MSGLGKITDSIISKTEADAAQIIKNAECEAEEITNAVKLEIEEKRKAAEFKTKESCDKIIQMGQAGDRQEARQIMLASKSKMISEIIDAAKNKMKSMEKEAYLEILARLIERYAEGKEGEILFSLKDKEILNSKIKGVLKKAKLKLSDEVCSGENGFFIRYGKIEINCSIDSIFEEKYSELTDFVNSCIKS